MNKLCAGALIVLSTPSWAAYQYYATDNLTSINAASWTTTGSVGASSLGLAASGSGGGTLISRIPIPDGTSEAEVRAALKLTTSGGTYTTYLQASADAGTSGSGSGTYLAFEMQNPQFDANGGCAANFLVFQSTSGVVSLLSSFAGTCRDGMVLRMAVHGNALLVWPDQGTPMEFVGVTPAAGQPGVGAYGTPSGNAVSQVQLGTIYRVAPAALDSQALAVSTFPRHVDLQWKPVPIAASSIGSAGYWIYRDGLYFRRTTNTTFSDETVSPGESHTYAVYTVDQHYNFSSAASVTVNVPPFATLTGTPPALPGGLPFPSAQPHVAGVERGLEPLSVPPPPPNGAYDPRRVGLMALGSYWGGAGEQIDTLSGNLNFSVPLVKPVSAGGGSATIGLSYNSQMWRQDSAGNWLIGQDVGFGLGWKVLAGSITPIWSGSQISYYLYVDSTGAEYRLDHQKTGNVWTSTMGTYVSFDANANILHSTDGSFWTMGSISASGEQDAGTLYPTILEDSNGNQIQITYLAGMGSSSANTSARISFIADARSSGTYQFSYSSQCSQGQCFAHLASISNGVGTPENYTFAYAANQSLASPFNSSSYGTWAFLQSVTVTGLGIAHQFQYDGSGEMTQLTTPLGGVMQWTYRTFTYGTSVSLREVQYRYLPMFAGEQWSLTHNDSYDQTQPFHSSMALQDTQTQTYKIWVFQPNSYFYTVPRGADTVALTWFYAEVVNGTNYVTLQKYYGYTPDTAGQPYTSQVVTYPDYGTGSPSRPTTTTLQTLDTYGNLTQMQVFDYGNSSGTPTRTYNFMYLNNSSYAPFYIFNRLASATVTSSAGTTTLVTNSYDSSQSPLQASNLTALRDPNYINTIWGSAYWWRGNVTQSYTGGISQNSVYQAHFDTGAVYQASDSTGNTTTVTLASNDVLPSTLTPNSNSTLATSLTYAASFAVTSVTGPNGATASTAYDTYGRPHTTTSPDGAVTTYAYAYYTSGGQNSQTATVNNGVANQWKKTVLDGFGRTISVLIGNGSTTVSETDTQYTPSACSPLGKVSAVSIPYAPGGTPVWTHYTYDASARTLTILTPDGASTTTYAYAANNTTITDPAGKWKTFTSDAFGNLLTVTEPDPASGNVTTNYTYNNANQLITVYMLRAGVPQTRSFGWTGSDLTSATNPENGTVNYTYDGAHHVLTRTDAKGQQTQYTYDIYGRLTLTKHLVGGTEDLTQRVTYYYDSLSSQPPFYLLPSGCCSNLAGRLAAVQFPNSNSAVNNANNGTNVKQLLYVYSYNQAGRVTMQDLRLLSGTGYTPTADYYASYAWDNMGRTTALNYPVSGPQTVMTYDAMSNLSAATESTCQTYDQNGNCLTWGSPLALASAAYSFAGQLTTLNFNNFSITGPYPSPWFQTETHTYNGMLQLTNITTTTTNPSGGQVNMTYTYSATQNNGRIVSSSDGVTGENVSYTYDSLNRLIAAATSGTTGVQWGDSYNYDGFGNLTSKVVTKGTAPSVYPQVDPITNRARMSGDYGFDANGNWLGTPGPPALVNTWNVENQLISNGAQDGQNRLYTYTYDPWGKRVLQYATGGSYGPTGTLYFYSITGQRLGTYSLQHLVATQVSVNMFFGGRMLAAMDRLGSVRQNRNGNIAYFPWGEERTSTQDGTDKFATYFRDGQFQDYANARYYNNNFGRFWSVDPGGLATANPTNPQSWNRYSYVVGDPVNGNDPLGLDGEAVGLCGANAIPGITLTGPSAACNIIGATAWSQGWDSWNDNPTSGLGQGSDPTLPVDQGALDEEIYAVGVSGLFWYYLGTRMYPGNWETISRLSGGTLGYDPDTGTLTITLGGITYTCDAKTGACNNGAINPLFPGTLPQPPPIGPRPFPWAPNPGNPVTGKCLRPTHPDPISGNCVQNPGSPILPLPMPVQPPPRPILPASPIPPPLRPLRPLRLAI